MGLAAIKAGVISVDGETDAPTPSKPVAWTGNATRPLSNPRLDALATPKGYKQASDAPEPTRPTPSAAKGKPARNSQPSTKPAGLPFDGTEASLPAYSSPLLASPAGRVDSKFAPQWQLSDARG